MSITETPDHASPKEGERQTAEPPATSPPADGASVVRDERHRLLRYNAFERIVHWIVAITFIALMLSGLALAYPRMAWLSGLFGGGQTMRAAHPWIGVAFTIGVVVMLAMWARGMLLDAADRTWFRRLRQYATEGHAGVDSGRWNGGQKAYFWFAFLFTIVLLATGIPLWFQSISWLGIDEWSLGIREWSRLIHNVSFLLMVGGFMIHVLLSAFLFPGTMDGMVSGEVSRGWAAWHHPRWFREQTDGSPDEPTGLIEPTGSDEPTEPEEPTQS